MCKLHKEYFNDPTPTDCISFPIDNEEDGYKLMGDVVVCPLVAKTYARTKKLDVGEELSLYIVHGLLHLIGYDDIDSRDRKVMRSAERRHLKNLRAKKLCLKVFG
jgi:probable rRNA maturation factor